MTILGERWAKAEGLLARAFKFGVVGLSGVFVNLLVSEFFFRIALAAIVDDGLRLAVSNGLGLVVSIFTNFLLNDRWTWGDRDKHNAWSSRLAKYYLSASVAGGVQVGVSWATFELVFAHVEFAVAGVSLESTVSICVGIGAGMVINFLGSHLWAFSEEPK